MAVNGAKLRSKMIEKGYSNYDDFAKAIDVNRDTVGNVIRGDNFPSYKFINNSYQVLDLSPTQGSEIFFDKNFREMGEKMEV